eukprot:CAMPEP_0201487890 /NCGR_PEP_ID=MMETSP0151_2-20130828/16123_1 /ASSEMBLY_ACC=CAM_ASM_000257 /TAXON_ID=200890 /ORGANISM="Paramoeba atlantica, Strain 621/1 / CCAP 1560/9" /LENGTH=452 /DNA_ID=CAMNT_0047873059 /DNA_START=47 /DNA_END=1405 /DNA_ORIENTATION=+
MKSFLLVCVFVAFAAVCSADDSAPLILTNYLDNPAEGRSLSQVTGLGWPYPSYSGYFTVDAEYGSNLFFWYFPAQNGNPNAPLLMWLNGGPGSSSLFGLFAENGPFSVSQNLSLVPNPYTWNSNFSMVYVDNPVGTGWSFTQYEQGYATDMFGVARNLWSLLQQFFTIFPDLQKNDFYVCAESYGGKYGPSISYEIHEKNKNSSNLFINLKGLSVGDGLMDPLTQLGGYADMWYSLGFVDFNEKKQTELYQKRILELIMQERYLDAFFVFDEFLNGDFYPNPTFFNNLTGITNYYNFDTPAYPPDPYPQYMDQQFVRQAIHVGSGTYWDYNLTVDQMLQGDWMKSVRPVIPTLLENYKVMIYNGQYDIILPAPMCEDFLRQLPWSGQKDYLLADKQIWHVENQPAGYVRQASGSSGSLTQVVVRQAGHLLPTDQPERALDLITNFVLDQPWN